ncbi:hypothetical protein [Paenibacillus protaetiae]|uniref:Uncharacterized protein n=1 Tax=Paenibacillus protaetiae TaxID=2509456 RepID=A0A4V0YEZ8_9BACL|nr:hypothetical protein [Paenibacillus protaetiae]QAY65961.1 hypothetical protein ET464_05735 [Paenibacillus protaetiae]
MIHEQVRQYYKLKKKMKEMEQELSGLRGHIVQYCEEQALSELEIGSYAVKIVRQERKDYDDAKLYNALPDPDLWRLLSKADNAKIAGLLKLNVINDEILQEAVSVKKITLLQVDKI